jgi:hypothetical protein
MNPLPTESQKATTASEVEVPSPVIDLSIYVMPAFATLAVSNLERSRRWYVEGLDSLYSLSFRGHQVTLRSPDLQDPEFAHRMEQVRQQVLSEDRANAN